VQPPERGATQKLATHRSFAAEGRMGARRLVWHVGFERNIRRRGSHRFEVRSEVLLSHEPPRIDYLLLCKILDAIDDAAETLRGLWPLLPRVSVVEYKSPGRMYRAGNLDRLWSYVHTYYADQRALPRRRADGTELSPGMEGAPDVWTRSDLCAVLVVHARTPSLLQDAEEQGLAWVDRGGGYWEVTGGKFALYVVEIDVVGPAEGDDLLYSLGHGARVTPEALRFWMELMGSKEAGMSMQDMEGYDELMTKLLASLPPEQRLAGLAPEQRLAGLAPEQRLAGLAPEQRLAGLAPEQVLSRYPAEQRLIGLAPEQRLAGLDRDHQVLALPVEILRVLPDDYVSSLSVEAQAEIRRRLQRNGH
jgi:hypothetical protein